MEIGGVYCQRLYEGTRIGGGQATATYLIGWDDLGNFVRAATGAPTYPGQNWGAAVSHPEASGYYAGDFTAEPVGVQKDPDGYGRNPPSHWKVALQYGPRQFPNGDDAVKLSLQIRAGGSILELPGMTLVYVSDGKKVAKNGGVFVGEINMVYTRHLERDVFQLKPTFDGLINHVNASTFQGYPAGTVLFAGYSMSEQQTKLGDRVGEVSFELAYRSIEWNKSARPGSTSGFDDVQYPSTAKVYPTGNLALLQTTTY